MWITLLFLNSFFLGNIFNNICVNNLFYDYNWFMPRAINLAWSPVIFVQKDNNIKIKNNKSLLGLMFMCNTEQAHCNLIFIQDTEHEHLTQAR